MTNFASAHITRSVMATMAGDFAFMDRGRTFIMGRMATVDTDSGSPKLRRRWFQFSMALLLSVMALVSVFLKYAGPRYREYLGEKSLVVPTDWDVATGKNIKWRVAIGSLAYPPPVISGDKLFIGTNNGSAWLQRYPADVDLGVMLCFRASDGKFLWQSSHEKLPSGRIHDWPQQGLCSTPYLEGNRMWYVSNRCEVICLDTEGFYDNENDGPYQSESVTTSDEADWIWQFDMLKQLSVSPIHMSSCSVTASDELLFVVTSNGANQSSLRQNLPAAPDFIALNKNDGHLVWQDASPGKNVLHGQWGSPAYAMLGGVPQVIFPGGDGWLYSFDVRDIKKGKSTLLWKFDCNPKTWKYRAGGSQSRNYLLTAPTVADGRVYISVGQDPEHGEGNGQVWCIDPTRRGDVSAELVFNKSNPKEPIAPKRIQAADADAGDYVAPNPNSALIWKYDNFDTNQDGTIALDEQMHRSLSRVTIKNNLALVTDLTGVVHCLDARTGALHWTCDLLAASWSTPFIAGDHVYVCDEDGDVSIFRLSADPKIAMSAGTPIEINMGSSIQSTPSAADNVLYVAAQRTLYAITLTGSKVAPAAPATPAASAGSP